MSQSSQESINYHYDANDRLFAELTDDLTSENADTTTIYGFDHTQQTEKTVYTDLLDEATIASLVSGADDSSFQRVSAQTFVYNLQGRMSEAVVDKHNSDGTLDTREKSSYEYDMRSFRVGQTAETWNESTGEFEFKSDTEFLVSHRNHTGYAQTLRETTTNADGSTKTIDYTFGADEISQRVVERDDQGNVTSDQTLVFGHDGHGSVRVLYDLALSASNLIAQLVTYSSYGVQIAMHSGDGMVTNAALSSLGHSGEHFDSSIQKSFNRARWYDASSGQWNRLDPFSGNNQDPQSLHKHAYVHGDPIGGVDPTGLFTVSGLVQSIAIGASIGGLAGGAAGAAYGAVKYGSVSAAVQSAIIGFMYGAAIGAAAGGATYVLGSALAVGGASTTGSMTAASLIVTAPLRAAGIIDFADAIRRKDTVDSIFGGIGAITAVSGVRGYSP